MQAREQRKDKATHPVFIAFVADKKLEKRCNRLNQEVVKGLQ